MRDALLQQFLPAAQDLREHPVDDLFGGAPAAEVKSWRNPWWKASKSRGGSSRV
jgi:hypothetical protein